MATRLPMRVDELPPLEPDSEDELKTPGKRPKKVAELSPLESDSDEDTKEDRLNNAILNDSFILSPSKSIEGETPVGKGRKSESNKDAGTKDICNMEDDSFAKRFQRLNLAEKENNRVSARTSTEPKSRHALFPCTTPSIMNRNYPEQSLLLLSHTKRTQAQHTTDIQHESDGIKKLSPCLEEAMEPSVLPSDARERTPPLVNKPVTGNVLMQSNKQIAKTTIAEPQEVPVASKDIITPFKSMEQNFVTPQVKCQAGIARRPNFSTNITQKSRTSLENEFRSQKILFRTPIAMSRPPSLINNSINLSLDDTVKEKDALHKEQKLSPVKEVTVKKSNENLLKSEKNIPAKKGGEGKVTVINGNEYVILKKLGSGGSSSVFLAKRVKDQKQCALKVVDLRGDQAVVEGYLNETRLLAKLQGNVNVVSLYEYQHLPTECILYMVMEKGDSDLNKILQAYKTDLPLHLLTSFWYQMLQAVNYIHENGVIHSDLKPANFLMVGGRLKLIDFGIASNIAIDSTSIIKFSQAGTFNYISPEALIDTSTGNSPAGRNRPKIKISTKSDVWSLGCILYLLLYKKTPFGHIKNIYAKVNAISNPATIIEYPKLAPYYPPILIEMAMKCLLHDPKKRSSVSELLKYPFDMLIPLPSVS
ncbi:dual specificity protein kinase Ttk isoform X2 [Hermetia illucens]|uniref:dual specificity protein kinase Ttk isoform X2 n=1 Tax=Hermetia illucens TaxID=343691 RepID=UPI0018CC528A|nr:dual specificity protein kinase Ttk isoform X2 [Hermetia illucens]